MQYRWVNLNKEVNQKYKDFYDYLSSFISTCICILGYTYVLTYSYVNICMYSYIYSYKCIYIDTISMGEFKQRNKSDVHGFWRLFNFL
jgi:hypothetical protein